MTNEELLAALNRRFEESDNRWEANHRQWEANHRQWEANHRQWEANERQWEANGQRWEAIDRRWEASDRRWEENQRHWDVMFESFEGRMQRLAEAIALVDEKLERFRAETAQNFIDVRQRLSFLESRRQRPQGGTHHGTQAIPSG